ncbi:MAG: hypothetical protein FGM15_09310 [Chthoniobacterales bacterium]|nr:hypothetical protein [Chthoniobacterales bacterium]
MKPPVLRPLFLLILAAPLRADVTVSTMADMPAENVAIAVGTEESTMAVNTRNMSNTGGEYKGVAQSFRWNHDGKLTGIGFYLHPDQSNYPWRSHETQSYVLTIHAGDGPSLAAASHEPVETLHFTIPGSQISNTGSKWLYLELRGVDLKKNQWYGFQIGPDLGATGTNRLFFQISNTDYEGNSQALNLAETPIPAEISYSNNMGQIKDLTFFMTAE